MEVREASAGYLRATRYKQTEVGVIPEDWEVKPLGEIGESLIGLTYKPADVRSDGILVLRSSNIQEGVLRFDDNVFVGVEVPERIMVRTGDILICVRNGSRELIGKCAQIDDRAKGMTFGAFMAVFRTPFNRFAYHQFQSEVIKRQIREHLGATINQITNKSLNSFCIPLPPTKTEQGAIAEALSDADTLIESLEKLLAKKRHLKQGAMQELLTGKKRLPGFEINPGYKQTEVGVIPKDWELRPLLTAVRIAQGQVDPKIEPYKSMFLVGPVHVESGTGKLVTRQTATEQGAISGKYLFTEGDIVYGKINPYLKKAFLADFSGLCSADMYPLKPSKDVSSGFILAVILGQQFTKYAESVSVRSGMPKINRVEMKEFVFPIPSNKAEQSAIAAILSDMDAEIAALEEKLAKARSLKQGMMQELLTGRIRLVRLVPSVDQTPLTKESVSAFPKSHNWQINEAVVISILAKRFGSENWPLGRKRYTKLSYLLHRYVERQAEGYLKKAAGPYNPATKYKGPEAIALKNCYVRLHSREKFSGFIAAEKIGEAESYFSNWYGENVLTWLEQFRYKSNDELEVLATVDMAMDELRRDGKAVELSNVKQVIQDHREWKAKLDRVAFSDKSIGFAIESCRRLFASEESG